LLGDLWLAKSCQWLKTVPEALSVAENSFIGMETTPKESVNEAIWRAAMVFLVIAGDRARGYGIRRIGEQRRPVGCGAYIS